jgi:hypothetical protein
MKEEMCAATLAYYRRRGRCDTADGRERTGEVHSRRKE